MNITIEFFKIYYIYNHHVGKKKNIGHKVNDKVSFWCDPSNYRQKKQITAVQQTQYSPKARPGFSQLCFFSPLFSVELLVQEEDE